MKNYVKDIDDSFIKDFTSKKLTDVNLISVNIYRDENKYNGFYVSFWGRPLYFSMPNQFWFDSMISVKNFFNYTKEEYEYANRYKRAVCKCLEIPEELWFDTCKITKYLYENNYGGKLFSIRKYKNLRLLGNNSQKKTEREMRKTSRYCNNLLKDGAKQFALRQSNRKAI